MLTRVNNSGPYPDGVNKTKVKLVDFGLGHQYQVDKITNAPAWKIFDEEPLFERAGTPGYRAPEISDRKACERNGYNAFKSDMWSLGVLVFAMVHGFIPFTDCKLASDIAARQVYLRQIQEMGGATDTLHRLAPAGAVGVSPALRALLDGLLQFDVSKRWTVEQVLESAWLQREDGQIHSDRFRSPPVNPAYM